jgi:hypothetical protein
VLTKILTFPFSSILHYWDAGSKAKMMTTMQCIILMAFLMNFCSVSCLDCAVLMLSFFQMLGGGFSLRPLTVNWLQLDVESQWEDSFPYFRVQQAV